MSRPGIVDVQFRIFASTPGTRPLPENLGLPPEASTARFCFWGRHDPYFALDEVLAYGRELDRLDMHIFDGGHLLLETHSQECAALMREYILNVNTGSDGGHS